MNRVSAAKPAVPMEVDVRGMTLDEAIAAVDIYLADATLAGLNEVSIIHGKGTGVLRAGIQRHLPHAHERKEIPRRHVWRRRAGRDRRDPEITRKVGYNRCPKSNASCWWTTTPTSATW